jgi:hypothetical protein
VKKWLPSLSVPAPSRTPSVTSRSSRGCSIRSSNEHIVMAQPEATSVDANNYLANCLGEHVEQIHVPIYGRSSKEDEAAPPAR